MAEWPPYSAAQTPWTSLPRWKQVKTLTLNNSWPGLRATTSAAMSALRANTRGIVAEGNGLRWQTQFVRQDGPWKLDHPTTGCSGRRAAPPLNRSVRQNPVSDTLH